MDSAFEAIITVFDTLYFYLKECFVFTFEFSQNTYSFSLFDLIVDFLFVCASFIVVHRLINRGEDK